jgi:cytoskeletal protein RodZ
MTPLLAVETWIAVAVVLVSVSALLLVLIVVAPWRSVRQEPPLDDAIESRILLGEDPAQIAEEEQDEQDQRESESEESDAPGPAA